MSDVTDDTDEEAEAQLRRALIRTVNTRWRFTAAMVTSLINFCVGVQTVAVLNHPTFPVGAVLAWAVKYQVNLDLYEPQTN